MRKIYFLAVFTFAAVLAGYSQTIPQGMNYQAIARDKAGHELANETISLQISLHSLQSSTPYYTETHTVSTNQFGLFSLVIGEGNAVSGDFSSIPWGEQEIWMDVSMQTSSQQDYEPVGSSKLWAVPYAFVAGKVSGDGAGSTEKNLVPGQCPCSGGITSLTVLYLGPSGVTIRVYNNQALQANQLLATFANVNNGAILTINAPNPPPPPPGGPAATIGNQMYFQYSAIPNPPAVQMVPTACIGNPSVTNPASPGGTWGNISVVSQTDANGETCTACNVSGLWYIGGNAVLDACNTIGTLSNNDFVLISNNTPRLVVSKGGDVTVNNNLNVDQGLNVLGNTTLNSSTGSTTNKGPFTVGNGSPTTLTGTLTTTGATQLNNTLTVEGVTNLNANLNVDNKQSTNLTGTLTVGRETELDSSLRVSGNTDMHGYLHVDNQAPAEFTGTLTGYLDATFHQRVRLDNASINADNDTSGALVVSGGTGIGQNLYVGGNTFLLKNLEVQGNTDILGYLHVDENSPTLLTGTLADSGDATFYEHVLLANGTLGSDSFNDGALVVQGGVGIVQNLNVGGASTFRGPVSFGSVVHFNDTVQSTNYNNGTIVVVGGAGIGKNLNVNGATGLNSTLNVIGATTLQSTLGVQGNTDLHGHFDVDNNQPSLLTGTLNVNGVTTLGNNLNVTNNAATNLSGTLTVGGATTINNTLTANGRTVINADEDAAGDHTVEGAYPFEVKGSKEGIRIQVNGNSGGIADMTNDYVQFVDNSGTPRGAILGETLADLSQDVGYQTTYAEDAANVAINTVDEAILLVQVAQCVALQIAADAAATPCVGLGACVAAPPPSMIAGTAANLVLAIANGVAGAGNVALAAVTLSDYESQYQSGLPGIYFNSGSGDYAEWLPKADPNEKIYRGDVVGVKGGRISKSTEGAEKLMVVSTMPIVLGNTPPQGKEGDFEKVAFIGQVKVKVYGKVAAGDYILGADGATGFGLAKHQADMTADDYQRIVGIAWEGSSATTSFINTAVGLNNSDFAKLAIKQDAKIKAQQDEINSLKNQMNETNATLVKLVPGFAAALPANVSSQTPATATNNLAVAAQSNDDMVATSIHYHQVVRADLEAGLKSALETLQNNGQTVENNAFLKKLAQEPGYKEKLFTQMEEMLTKEMEKSKATDKEFGH